MGAKRSLRMSLEAARIHFSAALTSFSTSSPLRARFAVSSHPARSVAIGRQMSSFAEALEAVAFSFSTPSATDGRDAAGAARGPRTPRSTRRPTTSSTRRSGLRPPARSRRRSTARRHRQQMRSGALHRLFHQPVGQVDLLRQLTKAADLLLGRRAPLGVECSFSAHRQS